jgi:N-acetyl-anhydromuramyl-L-alanine amidase AmpD
MLQHSGGMLLGVAVLLSLGSLGWVAREISSTPQGAVKPSLLQLLEEVGRPLREREPVPSPAPSPPPQSTWRTPLRQQCAGVDPRLRQGLQAQLERLESSSRRIAIHPTNYGERFTRDAFGNPVDPTPTMVVLHETVYGLSSAIQTFLTPHPRDDDQVSYHTLVGLNGQVVHTLDPTQRAFGAGNSAFNGQWVVTNPRVGGSVNNFALHLSLETPLDGENAGPGHSGYTRAQYDALAVVLADWIRRYRIPPANITTHRHVDLGGERADPRSFNWPALQQRLAALGVLC